MNDTETLFDKILAGEIPAKVAFENDYVLAFHDISPQAPIHVLVIPKTKKSKLSDYDNSSDSQQLLGVLMTGAIETAKHLGLDRQGYRLVINCGVHGQQTVNYIHVHILGGRQLEWPPG